MPLKLKHPVYKIPLFSLLFAPIPFALLFILPSFMLIVYDTSHGALLMQSNWSWPIGILMLFGFLYPAGVTLAWLVLFQWIWSKQSMIFPTSWGIVMSLYRRLFIVLVAVPLIVIVVLAILEALEGRQIFFAPPDTGPTTDEGEGRAFLAAVLLFGIPVAFVSSVPAVFLFRLLAFERISGEDA